MNGIVTYYGLEESDCEIKKFGSGLINNTWIVTNPVEKFILQKLNTNVFTDPEKIAWNLDMIDSYIAKNNIDYFFVAPVKTISNETLIRVKDKDYYRMFRFVNNSHSIDVVENASQAFEAAKQFGKFTRALSGMDVAALKITLPFFHDLSLRYAQFLNALQNGNAARIAHTKQLIDALKSYADIVHTYENIKLAPAFKKRVTHHDTKISNVLFNDLDQGICVIDLDTVMPGYFISDVGDMMRTYLCPVSEEEKDFSKIHIRDDIYYAIVKGYLKEMQHELTETEKEYFFYSGTFMIYMQALRFLTDYLNNDIYYGAKYEGHNLVRAQNQAILLQKLLDKKEILQGAVYVE